MFKWLLVLFKLLQSFAQMLFRHLVQIDKLTPLIYLIIWSFLLFTQFLHSQFMWDKQGRVKKHTLKYLQNFAVVIPSSELQKNVLNNWTFLLLFLRLQFPRQLLSVWQVLVGWMRKDVGIMEDMKLSVS